MTTKAELVAVNARLVDENLALRAGIEGVDQHGVHELRLRIIQLEGEVRLVAQRLRWAEYERDQARVTVGHLCEAIRAYLSVETPGGGA